MTSKRTARPARPAFVEPPVFEAADAPVEDFTCSLCRTDVPVVFVDEMVPSALHHKVQCAEGHVTNGMPVARFRL